jgi:hypothetical protein
VHPIIPAAAVNINPHSEIRRVEICINSPYILVLGIIFLTKHSTPAFRVRGMTDFFDKSRNRKSTKDMEKYPHVFREKKQRSEGAMCTAPRQALITVFRSGAESRR